MTTRAIILAAGKGTRMASYSNSSPKALLELRGETLLSRQLRSFNNSGINEFIIVGGYLFEQMEKFVQSSKYNIKLIYNPFYTETNSIASLWFARKYLEGDVFITNGDAYFDKAIFEKLLKNKNNYVFGLDESKRTDADYRVTMSDNEILDMGKDIPENEVMAEYIGIALIRKAGVKLFRDLLEKSIRNGNYNLWWEDLFVELMAKCQKISYVDVTGHLWFEVDKPKDYRKYQRCF
ncbi:MAG: phosphocholine cytidylyltransferase family protein [Candidatus Omnitrophica bacterium]|nr:phosphocholine cytidylyltransferase family protein [Candidatus Omnitrophota bacterium]